MKKLKIILSIAAAIGAIAIVGESGVHATRGTVAQFGVSDNSANTADFGANIDTMAVDRGANRLSFESLSADEAVAWTPGVSAEVGALPVPVGPSRADASVPEKDKMPAKIAPRDKMSGPVAALAAAGGPGVVELVVRYDQHPELFDDEFVASLGGEVTRNYKTLDMRAISIPAASLEALAGDDNVDWLSVDDEMSSTSVSSRVAANIPATGSPNVAYSGTGIGIALVDTGVAQHADLNSNIIQYSFLNGAYPTPEITGGAISSYNDNVRVDLFGHGTHVAGILTGDGGDSNNSYKGSSAAATILSLQVLDENGSGSMSDVMAALDWLLVYGSYFDIRAVNLSLGKGISESNTTDPLVLAVENLWDAGIVVVVAAGNGGFEGSMTVTSPGNSRKVITVGSMTDRGTGSDHEDDFVSSYSSVGPTIGDLVLKPDLVAPGNKVVASITANAKLAVDLPDRVISCTTTDCSSVYLELSGTSMATPMVSAAVALMLEKDPTLSPATVKARLMRSALKFDGNPSAVGAGLLDIDAAMNDNGAVTGEALSPLMILDDATGGVLIEDTALLWGDSVWGAGYLFSDGFNWADGYDWEDDEGVTASGYMWTDADVWATGYGWTGGGVSAKGYGWTSGISAKGYGWTGGVNANAFLTENDGTGATLNDD